MSANRLAIVITHAPELKPYLKQKLEGLRLFRNEFIHKGDRGLDSFYACYSVQEFLYNLIILPMKSEIIFQNSFPFLNYAPMEIKATSLIVTGPAEVFWMHIKISIVGAIVLSLPVILYQVWKFVAPGLFPNEKRHLGPFIVTSSLFFIIGAAFCFFVVLPFALGFLAMILPQDEGI